MRYTKTNALRLTVLAAAVLGASLAHAATIAPGKFQVGMEITYPPFESYDEKKNVVGSDPGCLPCWPSTWALRWSLWTPSSRA